MSPRGGSLPRRLDDAQREAVDASVDAQAIYQSAEKLLAAKVRQSVTLGVPVYQLARTLGVSRSRIRVLSR